MWAAAIKKIYSFYYTLWLYVPHSHTIMYTIIIIIIFIVIKNVLKFQFLLKLSAFYQDSKKN